LQAGLKASKVADSGVSTSDLESMIPKRLCLVSAILISRKVIKIEDVWPHLGNFVETKDELDEIEVLIKRQVKLVQYQY
jgi:hypothetical protein